MTQNKKAINKAQRNVLEGIFEQFHYTKGPRKGQLKRKRSYCDHFHSSTLEALEVRGLIALRWNGPHNPADAYNAGYEVTQEGMRVLEETKSR